jgi:hypothetical protein
MGGTACFLELCDEISQGGVGEKTTIFDGKIDLAQIHRNDTACANICVAHFGIAHLARGQADIASVGDQCRIGAVCHQAIKVWGLGQGGCVCACFIAFSPAI